MRSMTGFGTGEASADGVTVSLELRSVNHRFLDITTRLPAGLVPLENELRDRLKTRLTRGRITATAQLVLTADAAPVVLDEGRLIQGLGLLQRAAEQLELATGRRPEIGLEHLLAIPDLFHAGEAELAAETLSAVLGRALDAALDQLLAMKDREGAELAAELQQRLERLRAHLVEVGKLAPQSAAEALERLRARLAQLSGENLDPQRLAQEAALLADRVSINEECERLRSHCEQFGQALAEGEQLGKRLNFLLQEMHREVNTMGSKTNLLAITTLVVAMKDEVESMREQVQNLE
jgi:uncharacterized protein (TIGR00255 family)